MDRSRAHVDARYEVRDGRAEGDADQSSEDAENGRLSEELRENIAPGRTDGLADANFSRSLGNGHQHDVHDSDAADQKRNPGDAAQEES